MNIGFAVLALLKPVDRQDLLGGMHEPVFFYVAALIELKFSL
jgi:hypothetical protein